MRFFRNKKHSDDWCVWFAWLPVPFIDDEGGWAWLERVDRKMGHFGWIYRPIDDWGHPGF